MMLLRWLKGNLVRRLVAPSFLLSMCAIFLVGAVSYSYVRQLLISSTRESLEGSLHLNATKLTDWVSDQEQSLSFLSRIPHRHEDRISLLIPETLQENSLEGFDHVSSLLRFYAENHPGVRSLFLYSYEEGRALASSDGIHRSKEDEQTWEAATATEIHYCTLSGKPTVAISAVVGGAEKDGRSILVAYLDLNRVAKALLGHITTWKTGEVYLVDRQNRMINADYGAHGDQLHFLDQVHSFGIREALRQNEGFGLYDNYQGVPVVGAYFWMPELNVALLAEVGQDEIFAPARRFGLLISGFSLFIFIFLSFGNLMAARRVIAPLRMLSRATARVAAGDLTAKVEVDNDDETGVLAESFNSMVDRLDQLYRELKSNALHFSTIYQLSPDAMAVMSFETNKFLNVNDSFQEMFGFTADEAIGYSAVELGLWDSKIDRLRLISRLLKERVVIGMEMKFRRRTGELFSGLISGRVVELNGELSAIAVLWDMSELHRVEEELRSNKEHLQLLLDRMPIGCIVWNTKFEVELWNPMAEKIFGFTSSEAMGRYGIDLIVPEGVVPQLEWVSRGGVKGDETVRSEIPNRTKDGRIIVCDWYNTPLYDRDGRAIGAISMVRDVTDQKSGEQELERYRQNLEELVSQRTKQLKDAQSELVEKERLAVLGQLTATVSHELRNPLGTISNAIFSLRDAMEKGQEERLMRAMELADRNVNRCDRIIGELLNYTRSHDLIKESVDLGAWLHELLAEQQVPSSIIVESDLPPGVIAAIDVERFRRAVVNLIENAIQALEEISDRQRTVQVGLRHDSQCICVDVIDNGPGIAEDVKSRIFEPLFSTKGFGVGLGMSVVKNVLEDHGGRVEVRSESGLGTTVTLWLPKQERRGNNATDSDHRG